jgi:hypothetical protein
MRDELVGRLPFRAPLSFLALPLSRFIIIDCASFIACTLPLEKTQNTRAREYT